MMLIIKQFFFITSLLSISNLKYNLTKDWGKRVERGFGMYNPRRLYSKYLEYAESILGYAPSTISNYRNWFEEFANWLGDRSLSTVTIYDVDEYFAKRSKVLAPGSQNTERSAIRALFRYCQMYQKVPLEFDYSMIKNIKAPRPRVKFTKPIEVLGMISSLKFQQDKIIIATLFATGMRISELVRFSVEDLYGNEITIRGKGGINRVVPIPEDLEAALMAHIRENKLLTGAVFRYETGNESRPYSVNGVRNRLVRILGDKYKNPHSFRHGLGTELCREGANIRVVQEILGHTRLETTMIYTHITDQHKKQEYLKTFKVGFRLDKTAKAC